jgi:polyhydroxybutyrate depolymerase
MSEFSLDSASANPVAERATMSSTLDIGTRTRTYSVVGEPHPGGVPLVVVLHGSRQSGAIHRAFTGGALDRLATEGRAVVAYLDGYRGNWNDARRASAFPARIEDIDDVGFVRAVIDRLGTTHGIDKGRVVAVGYSNGGQMALRLLHEAPELLAGAVVVAATMPVAEDFTAGFSWTAPHPVPVSIVAGTEDRIVPFSGGRMAWWARKLFKVDGTALSAAATAAYFARRNGIDASPTTRPLVREDPRDAAMERTDYRGPGRASVALITVKGGGHTVPASKAAPRVLGRTGRALTIDAIVEELVDQSRTD